MNLKTTIIFSLLIIISYNSNEKSGTKLLTKKNLNNNWQNEYSGSDSLTVRNAHAMAYDENRNVVLLFGGANEKQVLADLWAWDGDEWNCLSNGGPPPRTFPALAYDTAEKCLILFGGNRVLFGTAEDTNTFLDDMWMWDGEAWHQVHTTTPSARAEASMTYDSGRKRIVLFGGYRNQNDKRIRLGDTWEWDGQQWELKSSEGPAPRNGTAMAYDSHRKCVVLFWGNSDSGQTWEWDGKNWERVISAETEGYFNSAMAYDIQRHSIIRFGGWHHGERVGDTWSYDGTRWTKVASNGPAARNHTSMAYDNHRNVIVLFGGHDGDRVFGDTWEWNGKKWLQGTEIKPRLRLNNEH